MLTEEQINKAGLLAIEADYGIAKKDMLPFSAEIESASGYGRGFCKGVDYAQEQLPLKWTSVKESFPEEKPFEWYRVLGWSEYSESAIVCLYQEKAFYNPRVNNNFDGNPAEITNEITHWMLLPPDPVPYGK